MTDRALFDVDSDPRWLIEIDGWHPDKEAGVEAVCALVNGYCGVRAAVEEGSAASNPATFLNGVFDAVHELVAQSAATPEHQVIAAPTPELVKAPEWSQLRLRVDGTTLDLDHCELLEQRRTLDMHRGVLVREWRLRSAGRTTRLRSLRFVSLDDRHVLAHVVEIVPEDWRGDLTIETRVDGDVTNEGGVRHLVDTAARQESGRLLLSARTTEGKVSLAIASAAELINSDGREVTGLAEADGPTLRHAWTVRVEPGRSHTLRKLCVTYTSRDDSQPAARALAGLDAAVAAGIATLHAAHADAWAARWQAADIEIADDDEMQRQTRFALYHLIGCANPDDEHASPGARSLTGERYKGHVFWDTEIFVFPFFVYSHPPTARALLMYRYHTLPAARAKAREQGYRGALYAWESTDSGVDVTPSFVINAAEERIEILTGVQEHHISADIAYAISQYWTATHDHDFIKAAGAEMLFEIARFWASRSERDADGRYHIRTVIGPDEYHEAVDDNAYTNAMARFALQRATETATWLQAQDESRWQSLSAALDLSVDEPAAWVEVAAALVDNLDHDTGVIEQHHGYFDLRPADLDSYEPRTQTMDVVLGWRPLTETQILKQADVVMMLALLPGTHPRNVHEANYHCYEPRTSHDSSLSASIHALMAARLGDLEDAQRYFAKAARIDLDFTRGVTAAGGVHIAALGGMWQALVFGFGGATASADRLTFEPHLPEAWGRVSIPLLWRGETMRSGAVNVRPG